MLIWFAFIILYFNFWNIILVTLLGKEYQYTNFFNYEMQPFFLVLLNKHFILQFEICQSIHGVMNESLSFTSELWSFL